MTTVREHHDMAMLMADHMLRCRQEGKFNQAFEYAVEAYAAEAAAVRLAFAKGVSVMTRMVLLKSAAQLAREAKAFEDGIDLCAIALAASELRPHRHEILRAMDTLRTYEHLQVEGVQLEDSDMQLSVAGLEAAPGFARASEVMRRVEGISRLAKKTVLRKAGNVDVTRVDGRFREALTPYLSVARAASYAVTLRFGVLKQLELDLASDAPLFNMRETIDEVIHTLSAYAAGGSRALLREYGDTDYTRSVSQLIRDLSPDDESVHTVGVTVMRAGKAIPIALPPRQMFDIPVRSAYADALTAEALPPTRIELTGTLLEGNAIEPNRAWATLVGDNNRTFDRLRYDEARFGDVIDLYWKKRVRATVERKKGRRLPELVDVRPA